MTRASNVRKRDVFTKYCPQACAVLETLLEKYQDGAITSLSDANVLRIPPFNTMGTAVQLLKPFGGREGFENTHNSFRNSKIKLRYLSY